MTQETDPIVRWVKASWPIAGGLWGAWVGLRGYFRVEHNADTFASMLAGGFFAMFGLGGLVAGAVCCWLVGRLIEGLLRRMGARLATALLAATLVNILVLWQVSGAVGRHYPGLRGVQAAPDIVRNDPTTAARGCALPPAAGETSRKSWEAECR